MDRKDWFFRQLVSSGDMDAADDGVEAAQLDLAQDLGYASVEPFAGNGGVLSGMEVSWADGAGVLPGPGVYDVPISEGVAYDDEGNRIYVPAGISVNISMSGDTAIGAGGTPTGGASTTPGGANERWVTIFVEFQRLLSDPRIDGAGATVYFARDRSFRFHVVQTGDLAAPAAPGARPANVAGTLRLVDVRRNSTGIIEAIQYGGAGAGDGLRQDWLVRVDSGATATAWGRTAVDFPVRAFREAMVARDALALLLGWYNDHARNDASTTDHHAARHIGYEGGAAWADGATTNPAKAAGNAATDGVEGQIDKVIDDLSAQVDPSGAKKVGARDQAGAGLAYLAAVATLGGAAPTRNIDAQLLQLLDAVNGRVLRGGDTMHGTLLPDDTTHSHGLGDNTHRWDTFFRDADVQHLVTTGGAAIGTGTTPATRTLGATGVAANRFNLFANDVDILNETTIAAAARFIGSLIPKVTGGGDLGSTALLWGALYSMYADVRNWAVLGADYLDTDAHACTARLQIPRRRVAQGFTLLANIYDTGGGTGDHIRIYAYETGPNATLFITCNAFWNTSTSEWNRDNGADASRIVFDRNTFQIQAHLAAGAANWALWDAGVDLDLTDVARLAIAYGNPNVAVPEINTITPKNVCKAWAKIATGVGGPTVIEGFNIDTANVVYAGSSVTVPFAYPLMDANGVGFVNSETLGEFGQASVSAAAATVSVINPATGQVDLSTAALRNVTVVVYGQQSY